MIEIKNLNKTFRLKSGNVQALKDVSLTVEDGEVYGVIGYSGAGKSTLVRCINLLEEPDSGEITVGGRRLAWTVEDPRAYARAKRTYEAAVRKIDRARNETEAEAKKRAEEDALADTDPQAYAEIAARRERAEAKKTQKERMREEERARLAASEYPPEPNPADYKKLSRVSDGVLNRARRGIGMIFQHFNLLDRGTVRDNVAYALRYCGRTRAAIERRVDELLDLVDLKDKKYAYPSQLSGGQKQRVAIARALANNPQVLLSDEATSALDPDATESILALLKTLNEKLGITIVLITHEMAVIKAVCGKVAVMEDGAVVEAGDVYDIFAHPKEAITRKFVGSTSTLAKVDGMIASDSPLVRTEGNKKLVKLLFGTDSVGDSVISLLSKKFDVDVNIVLASVEVLHGKPLGGMVVILNGDPKNIERALDFLRESKVEVEVLGA